jgi:thymidylate kinase
MPDDVESWLAARERETGDDLARELLYARRGWLAHIETDWNAPVVLGDRSILTSYATRLWRAETPEAAVARAPGLQPAALLPALVLLLDAPTEVLAARAACRHRCYGVSDESPARLDEDRRAYALLRDEPARFGLEPVRWVTLDASRPLRDVHRAAVSKIRRFAKPSLSKAPRAA